MYRLLLVLIIACYASARCTSCFLPEKENDEPVLQVIRLDETSGEYDDSEIVALDNPDLRRRRDIQPKANRNFCKLDTDCEPGEICLQHMICVKGRRQRRRSPINGGRPPTRKTPIKPRKH